MTITIEIDNEEALKEFGPALRQEANKRIEGRVDAVVEVGNYGSFDIAQETVTSPSPSPTPLPSTVPSPSPSPGVEYLPSPPPVSNNDSNYQDASSNYDDRQNNSAYSEGSNYSNYD